MIPYWFAARARAILVCYGRKDLDLVRDFYPNDRDLPRYTVSPEARRELLWRLLEPNAVFATVVAR
jgi:hypothetical protein